MSFWRTLYKVQEVLSVHDIDWKQSKYFDNDVWNYSVVSMEHLLDLTWKTLITWIVGISCNAKTLNM